MTSISPDQARAADASGRAAEIARTGASEQFKKDYRSYVDRLGPTIVMNGLGQALAIEFGAAGGDEDSAHWHLYRNVSTWLCRQGGVYRCDRDADALGPIIAGTQEQYLAAQVEALAWLGWHKNFCRALLPRDRDLAPADDS